ncbi:MAG: hypothetical protein ACRCR9_05435 [Chitinophagaceae bacterium]
MRNKTKFDKQILTVLLLLFIVFGSFFVKTEFDKHQIFRNQYRIAQSAVNSLAQSVSYDSMKNIILAKTKEINLLQKKIKKNSQYSTTKNNSQDIKKLTKRINKLNQQVEILETIKKKNDKKIKENNQQISQYRKQLNDLKETYQRGNRNIDSLTTARIENQAKLESLKQQKLDIESKRITGTKFTQKQGQEQEKMIANLTSQNIKLQQEVETLKQKQIINIETRKSLEQQVNILTTQNADLQKQIAIYKPKENIKTKEQPKNIQIEKPFVRISAITFSGIYEDEEGNDIETQRVGEANTFKLFFIAQTNNDVQTNNEKEFNIRITDSITKKLVQFSKDQEEISYVLKNNDEIQCNIIGFGYFNPKTKVADVEIVFDKTKDWEKKINPKNYYKVEVYCDSILIGQKTFTFLGGKSKTNKFKLNANNARL